LDDFGPAHPRVSGSAAKAKQQPTLWRRDNHVQQSGQGGRSPNAKQPRPERFCARQPSQKDPHQYEAQRRDGGKRRRTKHVEGEFPIGLQSQLASPAHLIEADRRERADQRKARGERKDELQRVALRRHIGKNNSADRID